MEKCFIFIGTTLEELSLMLYSMQSMVDFERRHKTSGSLNANDLGSKITNKFAGHAQSIAQAASQKKEASAERHFILKAIQNKCCLSYDQVQIKYPKSELDHVVREKIYFEPDLAIQGF